MGSRPNNIVLWFADVKSLEIKAATLFRKSTGVNTAFFFLSWASEIVNPEVLHVILRMLLLSAWEPFYPQPTAPLPNVALPIFTDLQDSRNGLACVSVLAYLVYWR